jgi:DNA-directed RNA polymerase specialized sigma24 family protein
MSDPLARVRRAVKRQQASELEYRAAVVAAVAAGFSFAEVARAIGCSRQSVRILVERERKRSR